MFARKCSATQEGMNEGWVINDGEYYFKYKKDAEKFCKDIGYVDLNEAYDNEVCYYTNWEDIDDYEWREIDGKLVEI